MFSWTLTPSKNEGPDCQRILSSIMDQREVKPQQIKDTVAIIKATHMRTCMRRVLESGFVRLEKTPTDPLCLSFFVETVAGIQYACNDPTVGKMKHLRTAFQFAESEGAIHFLKDFAANALQTQAYRDKNIWFMTRLTCMDAYSLALILRENRLGGRDILYYGGMSHTRNIKEFFVSRHFGFAPPDHPLIREFKPMAETGRLTHFCAIRLSFGNTLLLLGENHNDTHISFARDLVVALKRRCRMEAKPLLFMVEKHISNKKDKLQMELTCNQPDLAIHASRCDPFVDAPDTECCEALEIFAVDNRHTDVGFLRIEVFDIWHDADFQKAAVNFFMCSLQSIVNFCEAMLECKPAS